MSFVLGFRPSFPGEFSGVILFPAALQPTQCHMVREPAPATVAGSIFGRLSFVIDPRSEAIESRLLIGCLWDHAVMTQDLSLWDRFGDIADVAAGPLLCPLPKHCRCGHLGSFPRRLLYCRFGRFLYSFGHGNRRSLLDRLLRSLFDG